MTVPLIVIGVCLLVEAFFSGAELALISADKVKLRHSAEQQGRRRRKLVVNFIDDPGDLITTSLTGTNICVVLSTVTATVSLLPYFPGQAELISLAIMTPLVLIFGEIVPKSVFQHFADRIALRLIYIMAVFRVIFWPVVALGSRLSAVLLRTLRIDTQRSAMTREELRLLIKLPSRQGADRITPEEKKRITALFEVSESDVEEMIVPLSELTALPIDATLQDVIEEIADKGHTRIPIYKERVDQIEGIVHAFDVLRAEGQTGDSPTLEDLCRPALFVPENQPSVDTLVMMQREGQHMVVVVDEYGGAIGVVTIEDILEEIVGEIRDEYDEEEVKALIVREKGGAYRVKGRTEVDELRLQTRLPVPESDDYETVAGLVLDHVKRIPAVGESIDVDGWTITVTKATERSVDEVLIRPAKRRP